MKLSLLVPTFKSAETIERTLRSALAQRHRPLEVLVYDEASRDGTRAIVDRLLADADGGIETEFITSATNSGPVAAWRVLLRRSSGDWCCFVWADDVLLPEFSTRMMRAAAAAEEAGRRLVSCSADVETDGRVIDNYSRDRGLATPLEFSEGMFFRRFPLTQICAVYDRRAALEVFDRHVRFENPLGFDYSRRPYGNDVGFLAELAFAGGGVELLGDKLVRLTDSSMSMTRQATGAHLWQMRWQYTFNACRVWRTWEKAGVPGAGRLRAMGVRRLALCTIMLRDQRRRVTRRLIAEAVRAYLDFRRFDFQAKRMTLDEHRRKVARLGAST